jgi:hypothetical protein
MNPVYDFSAGDHAIMLGDQVRLEAYHRAIVNQVKPGMVVAEVGTGTGILSAYAATQTKGRIFAIELSEPTAKLAEEMFKAAGMDQVVLTRGLSHELTLTPQPDVLITETIGQIGPEENIVEICHDFKKRHPKLSTLVPSRLKVCAEPIRSQKVLDAEKYFYDYFASASFGSFDYRSIRPALARNWCSDIRFGNIDDAKSAGPVTVLADYHLGETETSAFSQVVNLTSLTDVDAVHLYFETQLDPETTLTSHFSDPETHWRHAYVSKPHECNRLIVSYSKAADSLKVIWET